MAVKIQTIGDMIKDEPLFAGRKLDKQTRELLQSGSAFSITWWTLLLDWYMDREEDLKGVQWDWSPETLEYEISREFEVKMNPRIMGRILAGRDIRTSNSFYRRPWFFIHDCLGLWSGQFEPNRYINIDDPAVIAWGLVESLMLNEPDSPDEVFSPEVRGFVSKVLSDAGLIATPKAISSVMPGVYTPSWDGFSDQDPSMFEMETGAKQADVDSIDEEVAERFQAVVKQIQSLPLRHGDTKGMAQMRLSQAR